MALLLVTVQTSLARAKAVEQPIGLSDRRNAQQERRPMPTPTSSIRKAFPFGDRLVLELAGASPNHHFTSVASIVMHSEVGK